MLSTMSKINSENLKNRLIKRTFDICGLNPWSDDVTKFEEYIASLGENKNYKALLRNNNDID